MTFERPLAIHNIVIPGDGTPSLGLPWAMAEIYKQVWGPSGLSTLWTASLAEDINALAVLSATLGSGGGSYLAGDILTLVGGTFTQAATIKVLTEIAGVIDTFEVWDAGSYSVVPSNPVSVTGGTGTGATFNATTGTRPGSFSFTLSRDGAANDPQINFLNFGDKTTPDQSWAYIGINPDGAADPILSSSVPAGPANFSGTVGLKSFYWPYRHHHLIVFEFDDAVFITSRTDAGTATGTALYVGRVLVPRLSSDIDGGGGLYNHRLDGLGCIGGYPYLSDGDKYWLNYGSYASTSMWRLGLGTGISVSDSPSSAAGWIAARVLGLFQYNSPGAFRNFAGIGLWRFEPAIAASGVFDFGELKHIKHMPVGLALQVYSVSGVDYLMAFYHSTTALARLWVHTLPSYNPMVPGVYT